MERTLVAFVLVLPSVVAVTIFLMHDRRRLKGTLGTPIGAELTWILIAAAVAPAGAPFAWQIANWYGVLYAAVAYAYVAITIIELRNRKGVGVWVLKAAIIAWVIAVVSLLPVVALWRLPWGHLLAARTSNQHAPINTAFLHTSMNSIQKSMSTAVTDIQREQRRIQTATTQLLVQVERQNAVIRDLAAQRDALTKEIERERAIAALTREQADAVRSALSKGKYVDYLVGFMLGIVASIIAAVVTRMIESRLAIVRQNTRVNIS